VLETQWGAEKRWVVTSEKEALSMIEQEMPETDAQATYAYIVERLKSTKMVTLGSCRFRLKP
jgi:hypothetical protein